MTIVCCNCVYCQQKQQQMRQLTGACVGKLHFVKFETAKIGSAMSFIRENCLHMHRRGTDTVKDVVRIKATGGGAFKFADVFQVDKCLSTLTLSPKKIRNCALLPIQVKILRSCEAVLHRKDLASFLRRRMKWIVQSRGATFCSKQSRMRPLAMRKGKQISTQKVCYLFWRHPDKVWSHPNTAILQSRVNT